MRFLGRRFSISVVSFLRRPDPDRMIARLLMRCLEAMPHSDDALPLAERAARAE